MAKSGPATLSKGLPKIWVSIKTDATEPAKSKFCDHIRPLSAPDVM